jgi:hypothetical protein
LKSLTTHTAAFYRNHSTLNAAPFGTLLELQIFTLAATQEARQP